MNRVGSQVAPTPTGDRPADGRIDVNVMLGHYAYRDLPVCDVAGVCELLRMRGVAAAIVGATPTLLFRDAYQGHRRAFAGIGSSDLPLYPTLTIDPTFPGWQRDLTESVAGIGYAPSPLAIRLYPGHHRYELSGKSATEVATAALELDLPLLLTGRIEDRRQRHAWDFAPDLILSEVVAFAAANPGLRLALLNWQDFGEEEGGRYPQMDELASNVSRLLIDPVRAGVLIRGQLPRLLDTLGVGVLAYGSFTPFIEAEPTLLKLAVLGLAPDEAVRVDRHNALEFFSLGDRI